MSRKSRLAEIGAKSRKKLGPASRAALQAETLQRRQIPCAPLQVTIQCIGVLDNLGLKVTHEALALPRASLDPTPMCGAPNNIADGFVFVSIRV